MSICTQPSHICNLERNSVAEMLLRNPLDSRKDSNSASSAFNQPLHEPVQSARAAAVTQSVYPI